MGRLDVDSCPERSARRAFMKRLLDDVWALEAMIRDGMVERGVRRIGAEQEFVLVQDAYRPAPISLEVLERLGDPSFTTELARYNVELNLEPLLFQGDCLSRLHRRLDEQVGRLRAVVRELGADVLLTGILPTLRLDDLGPDAMTPMPRYAALNDALNRLRGGAYELRIQGIDEVLIKHDTVMLEACNTSFQLHLQVDPEEFARVYNLAQVATAPVLAAAVNSPLLFGRRLWRETRIAVFQQAVDTRTSSYYLNDHAPRVHFGRRWVKRSVLELFQEDISRFPVLLSGAVGDDPFVSLAAGVPPLLRALQLHNGTVYRWNRPCYGVFQGKAHLRIENRVLPAGPSVIDQIANAAFWLGLTHGLMAQVEDVSALMSFDHARANFLAAARQGLGAQFTWLDGRMIPAKELILDELLDLAHQGLRGAGLDGADADRYLGVVEERVRTERTGARWQLDSLARMQDRGTLSQQLCALTAASIARQQEGKPVHEWPPARLTAGTTSFRQAYTRVEQIMTTDVLSVQEGELVQLVARLMDWHNIRYVPVLTPEGQLAGLVSHRALLRHLSSQREACDETPVSAIMHRAEDLATVRPDTPTLEALELMRTKRVGCLPVLVEGALRGVLTERNFMQIAGQLLERELRGEAEAPRPPASDPA